MRIEAAPVIRRPTLKSTFTESLTGGGASQGYARTNQENRIGKKEDGKKASALGMRQPAAALIAPRSEFVASHALAYHLSATIVASKR